MRIFLILFVTAVVATAGHASEGARTGGDGCDGGGWKAHSRIASCDGCPVADQASERIPPACVRGVTFGDRGQFRWMPGPIDLVIYFAKKFFPNATKWISARKPEQGRAWFVSILNGRGGLYDAK